MGACFANDVLKRARLDLGMTQEEAAERLGVNVRTYRRYENGQVNAGGPFQVRTAERRRFLAALSRELGIAEEDLILEQRALRAEAPPWPARWVHPLPRAPVFVGRAALSEELGDWVRAAAPLERVRVLVGAGGTGKSALAELIASLHASRAGGGGLFVWSYYEDDRTEQMLGSLLRYLERDPAHDAAAGERLECIVEHLEAGLPHLLVLDGLEVVQSEGKGKALGELDDPSLSLLLKHLARGLGRTRVLVTTRFPVVDLKGFEGTGVCIHVLPPLDPAESRRLLLEGGVRESSSVDALVEHYGGHPLTLSMLASYIAKFLGGRAEDWKHFDPKDLSSDVPDARRLARLLDSYRERLPNDELEVLTLLCTFAHRLDLDQATRYLSSNLSLEQMRRALIRLEDRGLVHGAERPSAHAFVREHFADRALCAHWLSTGKTQRMNTVLRARRGQDAGLDMRPQRRTLDDNLEALQLILDKALYLGDVVSACALYQIRFGGFDTVGLVRGEMAWGERTVRRILEHDRSGTLSAADHHELLYDWALYLGALGSFERSGALFVHHAELVADNLPELHSMALRAVAYNLLLQGKLAEALAAVERSIEVAPSPHVPRAVALRGAVLHSLGRMEEAGEAFDHVRQLGDQPLARRGLWEAEYRLDLGDTAWVLEQTRANLAHCEELRWGGHVAQCHIVLGSALLDRDLDASARHLDEARRWTRRTGEVELRIRAHILGAALHRAHGHEGEARAERAEGLRLAEDSGAALLAKQMRRKTVSGTRT